MGYGVRFRIWGDRACFTRPEMKVERVSYDIITPSAARGILEAIYWKPAIRWVIDRIHVLRPIRFDTLRRNEVTSVIPVKNISAMMNGSKEPYHLNAGKDRAQRSSLILREVEYVIDAHFEMTPEAGSEDSIEKHYNIARRRLDKGQCFNQPYLGCREFPAHFELYGEKEVSTPFKGDKDLGWMLLDLDYRNRRNEPYFFRAIMKKGIVEVPLLEEVIL